MTYPKPHPKETPSPAAIRKYRGVLYLVILMLCVFLPKNADAAYAFECSQDYYKLSLGACQTIIFNGHKYTGFEDCVSDLASKYEEQTDYDYYCLPPSYGYDPYKKEYGSIQICYETFMYGNTFCRWKCTLHNIGYSCATCSSTDAVWGTVNGSSCNNPQPSPSLSDELARMKGIFAQQCKQCDLKEKCDGHDNDFDGAIDEDIEDVPDNPNQKGVCSGSRKKCVDGKWEDDYSGVKGYESTESSCDGKDNDCDGNTDNLEAPLNPNQEGVCAGSKQKCAGEAGWINHYEGIPGYQVIETKCDGKDNDCNPNTKDPCCEIGDAKFDLSYVYPLNTGKPESWSKANLYIGLKQPSATQCKIDLFVEPEIGSGGHDHNKINDRRPTGKLSSNSVIFNPNETSYKTVEYTSSIVAGTENVRLKVNGQPDKIASIDVKVPGLQEFTYQLYVQMTGDSYHIPYRLKGETTEHVINHYGTFITNRKLLSLAVKYTFTTNKELQIDDMSLKWGGLFDIKGTWAEDYHISHRAGKHIDIKIAIYNRKTGRLEDIECLNDHNLRKLVEKEKGVLLCEPGGRKHITF